MRHVRSFGILFLATSAGLLTGTPAEAQAGLLHGRVTAMMAGMGRSSNQGYLGIDLRDISEDQVTALKLKDGRGAEVIGVDHDGPACKSGLLLHDVILQINGQVIENQEQLRRMMKDTPPGRQLTVLISRDGQQRTLQIQTANREEVERQAWEKHYIVPEPSDGSSAYTPRGGNSFLPSSKSSVPKGTHTFLGTTMLVSSSYTGAKLEVMGPQLAEYFGAQNSAGLLVRSVDPNSPAADAGMRAGDVVVKLNSVPVVNGSDWSKIVHENRGKTVNVIVLREKKEQTLTLTPDGKKRSAVEPWMSLEGFFGDSGQALAPMLQAMAARMHQQLEEVHATPEMAQMMARLNAWSNNPALQRQMETARQQFSAAAEAAHLRMNSPEFRRRMAALHAQMQSAMRLD